MLFLDNMHAKFTFFLFPIFVLIIMFLFVRKADFLCDERAHFMTISEITNNNIRDETFARNAQIPTYYYLMSIFTKFFTSDNIANLRLIQTIFSIITIYIVWLICQEVDPQYAKIKTLQILFLPVLNIFLVFIYNESLTLLFTLLSFYFVLKRKFLWGWVTLFLSITLRQNNIIWLLFLLLYQWWDIVRYDINITKISKFLKQIWGYLSSILFIVIFFVINKGPALADKQANPLAFHIENIYFLLLIIPILFLPILLFQIPQILNKLTKHKWILLTIPFIFILYWYFFKADNFFNSDYYIFHLRNKLINAMLINSIHKIIYFLPILFGIALTFYQKLLDHKFYALYIFDLFYLATLWLIEPRYYIIPLVFYLIFRKTVNKKIEIIQVIYFAILSLINLWGSVTLKFFL